MVRHRKKTEGIAEHGPHWKCQGKEEFLLCRMSSAILYFPDELILYRKCKFYPFRVIHHYKMLAF